jgi:hypothetical protein
LVAGIAGMYRVAHIKKYNADNSGEPSIGYNHEKAEIKMQ